jgi:hypothetical protein
VTGTLKFDYDEQEDPETWVIRAIEFIIRENAEQLEQLARFNEEVSSQE